MLKNLLNIIFLHVIYMTKKKILLNIKNIILKNKQIHKFFLKIV